MDARRQPIDQPTPALLINGVLAILRSQGFAWADIAVNEFAAQLSAAAGLPQTQVKVMCAPVYLPRARISAQLSFFSPALLSSAKTPDLKLCWPFKILFSAAAVLNWTEASHFIHLSHKQ